MNIVFTRSSTIYDDSRSTKEICTFLDNGFHVIVLGWDRNGTAEAQCKALFADYGNRISFRFYSGKADGGTLQKVINRIKWGRWLKKTLSGIRNIDVIHACDYDTGATVRRVASKKNIKYVYDIFDYYVDAHQLPAVFKKYIEADEIRTINQAEVTIICTEERRAQIKKAKPKKVLVIHNSPDVKDLPEVAEEYDYAYCGSLYNGRLIEEILSEYTAHDRLKFVFAGYGQYSDIAGKLASKYDTFMYLGSIPYAQVLDLEKKSKVISAIYEPTNRNHQLCAPNKFYEALSLGKAVIVCRGTGIDRIVEKYKIGCVINYSAEEFYKVLEYLLEHDEIRKQMGATGRKLYEDKYRWSIMRDKLMDEYKIICKC